MATSHLHLHSQKFRSTGLQVYAIKQVAKCSQFHEYDAQNGIDQQRQLSTATDDRSTARYALLHSSRIVHDALTMLKRVTLSACQCQVYARVLNVRELLDFVYQLLHSGDKYIPFQCQLYARMLISTQVNVRELFVFLHQLLHSGNKCIPFRQSNSEPGASGLLLKPHCGG